MPKFLKESSSLVVFLSKKYAPPAPPCPHHIVRPKKRNWVSRVITAFFGTITIAFGPGLPPSTHLFFVHLSPNPQRQK
jgi:hypothetical protein